jgi:L-seryl-tRNA(Ser) seleniumtransferase
MLAWHPVNEVQRHDRPECNAHRPSVTDRIVNYARGSILKSTDEEVARMLKARNMVGERVRAYGKESVYDLSGMNRGSGLTNDEVPDLTSHVPFFARFEGHTEPLALKHMGADPERHAALILNRVSAASFIALTTLLGRGDKVYGFAPAGGVTHPSAVRPIAMAGAELQQFHSYADLEQAWAAQGAPRLLLITPISASKKHIPYPEFQQALRLPRGPNTWCSLTVRMASRIAFFDEPRTFAVGEIDLAVCSADKHVAGPRAGVFVGRKDLVTTIGSRAYELGLEAQAGQYVGVANALRDFDPKPVKQAGELAKQLVGILAEKYGEQRAYIGGPGVSIAGDDVLEIARSQR